MWALVIPLLVLALGLFIFRLYFLREPVRDISPDHNLVSPANGRVIKIIRFSDEKIDVKKGLAGNILDITEGIKEGIAVIIYMNPLNVHVQRAPCDGRIVKVKHSMGKFLNAKNPCFENERNEILMEDLTYRVKVIQVAGFLVRRIECFVKPGDEVLKGQRIGRINFGSQVIAILPKNAKCAVKEGDHVIDGETVIARF